MSARASVCVCGGREKKRQKKNTVIYFRPVETGAAVAMTTRDTRFPRRDLGKRRSVGSVFGPDFSGNWSGARSKLTFKVYGSTEKEKKTKNPDRVPSN